MQALQSRSETAPTRARYWVIVFAVTLAVITYIDRTCISQAAGDIQRDLGLTKKQMGCVFAAFSIAYGLFEIPGGWMGDRFGPRSTLMRVVLMWSFFTSAIGAVWSWTSLLVCQFCFGIGEAGCFPNLTKVFTIWLTDRERVKAQGIIWLSARWGSAFTPLLVIWVLSFASWRVAFPLFGSLGIIWAVLFYRWFRDDPRKHPSVNSAEMALLEGTERNAAHHGNVPWKRFLTSYSVWLLWLQYFCINYAWWSYIMWLPTYLRESSGDLSNTSRAVLAGLPLFFGGIGSFFTGMVSARVATWLGNTLRARRLLGCVGFGGAATMLYLSTQTEHVLLGVICLGFAAFSNDLSMPGSWGACMDVGGRFAGSLSGSMNMIGQMGSAIGQLIVPMILEMSGNNWKVMFWAAAGVYLVGAVVWLFIDPVTPLDRETSENSVPGAA